MFHLWAEPKSLFVNLNFVLRSEGCPNILAEKDKLNLWVTRFLYKPIHLNLSGTIWNIGVVISQAAALKEIPKVFKRQMSGLAQSLHKSSNNNDDNLPLLFDYD